MATILKSNTTVSDPTNKFQYYSKFGAVDKDMREFINGLDESGYALTQTEFNAFATFRQNLIDKRLWAKVYEVYPMIGNDYISAGVKLKSLNGKSKMLPVNGLSNDVFEFSGSKILGKKVTATSQTTQPAYNTQLKVSELPNRTVGYHVYMGQAVAHSTVIGQTVLGTRAKGIPIEQPYSGVSYDANRSRYSMVHLSTTPAFENPDNSMGLYSFVTDQSIVGVSNKHRYFKNGAFLHESIAAPVLTPSTVDELPIYFFAGSNPNVGDTTATNSYSGKIRFGCVTSGQLSTEEVASLYAEINILLATLGKFA